MEIAASLVQEGVQRQDGDSSSYFKILQILSDSKKVFEAITTEVQNHLVETIHSLSINWKGYSEDQCIASCCKSCLNLNLRSIYDSD